MGASPYRSARAAADRADALKAWASGPPAMPKELVGSNPDKLAALIEAAILECPSENMPGVFDADIGVFENSAVRAAIAEMRKKLPTIAAKASEIVSIGEGDGKVVSIGEGKAEIAPWTENVNGLRFLLAEVLDPQGTLGDEYIESMETALRMIAMMPPVIQGVRGRAARKGRVNALVKAVCIYRREEGLRVEYNFKIHEGEGILPVDRIVDTNTAVLAAKVAEFWGIHLTAPTLRTALRNQLRDGEPDAGDLLFPPRDA